MKPPIVLNAIVGPTMRTEMFLATAWKQLQWCLGCGYGLGGCSR